MSHQEIDKILSRIVSARKDSPIAVFADDPDHRHLRSVFGATTGTKREINAGSDAFVGIFHQRQDRQAVRAKLKLAERTMRARK